MVVSLAVALAALFVASRTAAGRRFARDRIVSAVDRAIPGSVEIDAVETLWPARTRVRGLVFRDPEGRPVIEVERASIDLDLAATFGRRLRFRSAHVKGARIAIATGDGRLGIERAFSDGGRDRSDGGEERKRRIALDLASMRVDDARLVVDMAGERRVVMDGIDGFVGVYADPGAPVRVKLDRVSARLAESPAIDVPMRFDDLSGTVRAKSERVVDVEFRGAIAGDAMRGAFRYFPDRTPKAELALHIPEPSAGSAALSVGLGAAGRFAKDLHVTRSLGGRRVRATR